jgi:hypothetical protein
MSSPAIIISTKPNLTSCVFTEEFGPIIIHSVGVDDENSTFHSVSRDQKEFQPDIDDISLLNVQKLASEYPLCSLYHDEWIEHDIDLKDYEVSLFNNQLNGSRGVQEHLDNGVCRLLATVAQMKGLKDRLVDASMSLLEN